MSTNANININIDAKKGGKTLRNLTKDIKGTGGEVKNIRQRLMDLQLAMGEIGDIGSPEFQKLAKEAGVLKDKMNNANASIKLMSQDFPKLAMGKDIMMGVGGATQVAMGAMSAFGLENENATKAIQMMMGVQSMMNGVNAVANTLSDESVVGIKLRTFWSKIKNKEDKKGTAGIVANTTATGAQTVATNLGTKATKGGILSMKTFNAVIKANPIMMLITGVGMLIGAMSLLGDETESLEDKEESLNKAREKRDEKQSKRKEGVEALNAVDKERIRQMELNGATEQQIQDERNKIFDRNIENAKQELIESKKHYLTKEANYERDKQAHIDLLNTKRDGLTKSQEATLNMEIKEASKKRWIAHKLMKELEPEYIQDKANFTKAQNDKTQSNEDFQKGVVDGEKKTQEEKDKQREEDIKKYKDYLANRNKAQRQFTKMSREHIKNNLGESIDENMNFELESNQIKYEQQREDIRKNDKLTRDEKKKHLAMVDKLEQDGIDKIEEKRIKMNEDLNDKIFEITASQYEIDKKAIEDNIQEQRETLLKEGKLTKEMELALNAKAIEQLTQLDEDYYSDRNDLREEDLVAGMGETDKQIHALTKEYEDKLKLAKEHGEDITNITKEYEQNVQDVKDEARLGELQKMESQMEEVANIAIQVQEVLGEAQQRATENRLNLLDNEYNAQEISLNESLANKEISQREYDVKLKKMNQQKAREEKEIAKRAFEQQKAMDMVNITIATTLAVMNAFASGAKGGLLSAGANAVVAGAFGAVQLGMVASQKFKASKGGVVPDNGKPSNQDSVDALLAPNEVVINSRSSQAFMPLLSAINQAGGGNQLIPSVPEMASSNTINVYQDNTPIRAYVVEQDISDSQSQAMTYKQRSKLF